MNARGIAAGHALSVAASPSLDAVRALLADSDCVLALGTEFGPTDHDMYASGGMPAIETLIRVDVDGAQLARRAGMATMRQMDVQADSAAFARAIAPLITTRPHGAGARRAGDARAAAFAEIGPRYQGFVRICDAMWQALPDAIIVGDSTQLVYAGNLWLDAPRPGAWFNAATGFGALGYGPPAAIGAAIADPSRPVICIAGDGGMQFSLAEIGSAVDAKADVSFVVWNNDGYQEIESAMRDAGVTPEGVKPSAPDFTAVARAFGMAAERCDSIASLRAALAGRRGPRLIQIDEAAFAAASSTE
jgi:acetolactate synthase I/II/III large subunit